MSNDRSVPIPRPKWLTRYKERMTKLSLDNAISLGTQFDTWLNHHDPHYAQYAKQWDFVHDHLTARVLDDDRVEYYVFRRVLGESEDAYYERLQMTDYTPHFLRAVIALGGMLFANSASITRVWEESMEEGKKGKTSLGSPTDPDNVFSKFWQDCDGEGLNYESFLFDIVTHLIAFNEVWIMLEGWDTMMDGKGKAQSRPPRLKLFPPQNVLRTVKNDMGNLDSVKVLSYMEKEIGEGLDAQKAKVEVEPVYTVYFADGFQQFKHSDTGEPEETTEGLQAYGTSNGKPFVYQNKSGHPVPPIFRVKLPFEALVGYVMANKANVLLNHDSGLNMLLHSGCFVKLMVDVVKDVDGILDTEGLELVDERVEQGSGTIPGAGNKYVAPPMEPAKIKTDILKHKAKEFYEAFFQTYGDSAVQKTATELRQDWAMGIQAYLTMLSICMEEAEGMILHRLEQAFKPNDSGLWGIAKAMWPDDFSKVEDPMQKANEVIDRLLGSKVPADATTIARAVYNWLETYGFELDDDQKKAITERIDALLSQEEQERAAMKQLGMGA